MNFKRTPSALHFCSRFFQAEYDVIDEHTDTTIYTVYSAPQRYSERLKLQQLGLQRFAILWCGSYDYTIFEIIERALVADLLSPISILHMSDDNITIVGTLPQGPNARAMETFYDKRWLEVASLQWESWGIIRVTPENLHTLEDKNPVRHYVPQILETENFGVFHFDDVMFAFGDIPSPP